MKGGTSEGLDMIASIEKLAATLDKEGASLAKADRFILEVSRVPEFTKRIQCMKFQLSFDELLETARKELVRMGDCSLVVQSNDSLPVVLGAALQTANLVNEGNPQFGELDGMSLPSLGKLGEFKATTGGGGLSLLNWLAAALPRQYRELFDSSELHMMRWAASRTFQVVVEQVKDLANGFFDISQMVEINQTREDYVAFVQSMQAFVQGEESKLHDLLVVLKVVCRQYIDACECFGDEARFWPLKGDGTPDLFSVLLNFSDSLKQAAGTNREKKVVLAESVSNLPDSVPAPPAPVGPSLTGALGASPPVPRSPRSPTTSPLRTPAQTPSRPALKSPDRSPRPSPGPVRIAEPIRLKDLQDGGCVENRTPNKIPAPLGRRCTTPDEKLVHRYTRGGSSHQDRSTMATVSDSAAVERGHQLPPLQRDLLLTPADSSSSSEDTQPTLSPVPIAPMLLGPVPGLQLPRGCPVHATRPSMAESAWAWEDSDDTDESIVVEEDVEMGMPFFNATQAFLASQAVVGEETDSSTELPPSCVLPVAGRPPQLQSPPERDCALSRVSRRISTNLHERRNRAARRQTASRMSSASLMSSMRSMPAPTPTQPPPAPAALGTLPVSDRCPGDERQLRPAKEATPQIRCIKPREGLPPARRPETKPESQLGRDRPSAPSTEAPGGRPPMTPHPLQIGLRGSQSGMLPTRAQSPQPQVQRQPSPMTRYVPPAGEGIRSVSPANTAARRRMDSVDRIPGPVASLRRGPSQPSLHLQVSREDLTGQGSQNRPAGSQCTPTPRAANPTRHLVPQLSARPATPSNNSYTPPVVPHTHRGMGNQRTCPSSAVAVATTGGHVHGGQTARGMMQRSSGSGSAVLSVQRSLPGRR